ncbi:MAG: hypothetical protein ABIJ97_15320 [Bacteroidota bacterium]
MPIDSIEVEKFVQLNQILLSLYQQGKTLYDLDSADMAFIRNLAYECPEYNVIFSARSILEIVTGEIVEDCPEELNSKSLKLYESFTNQKAENKEFSLGDNYPDPITNKTTIPYILPEGVTGKIIIKDMLGKTIAEYDATGGENELLIDCKEFAIGTYVYGLVVDDLLLEYKQMIITK